MDRIPKKIHQIWFQGEDQIPSKHTHKINSWKSFQPNYDYQCWDEYDIRKLLMNYYPWFLNQWESYKYMHQKIDTAKYFILDNEGGVYIDIDVECVKSIDDLLNRFDLLVTEYDMSCNSGEFCIPIGFATEGKLWKRPYVNNGIIASKPKHPFWKKVFKSLQSSRPNGASRLPKVLEIMRTTGPSFLTENLHNSNAIHSDKTFIAPPDWFEPGSIQQYLDKPHITSNTRAIHHFELTWVDDYASWVKQLQYVKHHWKKFSIAIITAVVVVCFYFFLRYQY